MATSGLIRHSGSKLRREVVLSHHIHASMSLGMTPCLQMGCSMATLEVHDPNPTFDTIFLGTTSTSSTASSSLPSDGNMGSTSRLRKSVLSRSPISTGGETCHKRMPPPMMKTPHTNSNRRPTREVGEPRDFRIPRTFLTPPYTTSVLWWISIAFCISPLRLYIRANQP